MEREIVVLRKDLEARQQYAATLKQKLGLSEVTGKLEQDLKIEEPKKMTKTQKQRVCLFNLIVFVDLGKESRS
jgi:hypothetical protein